MRRRIQGILAVGLLAVGALLAPVPAQAATSAPVIIGGWKSKDPTVTQIVVFGQDGSVTGNAGCNDFSSWYTFTTKKYLLTIQPIVVGTKLCDPITMAAEKTFLSKLQAAKRADTSNCLALTLDLGVEFWTLGRYPDTGCKTTPSTTFVPFVNSRP